MGLSLWLVPDDPRERGIIIEQMNKLRERIGHSASSAFFPPHVTLLAGIDSETDDQNLESIWTRALDGLQKWKRDQGKKNNGDPIKCSFSRLMSNGMYFQCILLALRKDAALISLNRGMREALSLQDQSDYFPHLSLLYSSITAKEANGHIEEMNRQGVCRNTPSEDQVDFGSESDRISEITLCSLELWNTNGSVSEWRRLQRAIL